MSCATAGMLPVLEFGVVSISAPGERQSGDLHLVSQTNRGALVAVVDGLGHGQEAANAARSAVELLSRYPNASLIHLVRGCHDRLKGTRGAVMSLVALDGNQHTATSLGVGNIEGLLLSSAGSSGIAAQSIMQRSGVVGCRLPSLQAVVQPVAPGDLLILFTDGIRSDFSRDFPPDASCSRIAKAIAANCHRGTDDTLVLVARYRGPSHE